MRIRTIKPEFWSHPVIANLDDGARLLAIGLLNLADDDGFFLANPTLVRNALRPFDEDSTRTRRALDTLSKVGWIEVREHPEQGQVAKVVNFAKHQRIDRPTPSKLATYFNSTSPRRALDEPSTLERKGKEQGKEWNGMEEEMGFSLADEKQECHMSSFESLRIRVCKMMGRRDSTKWSDRELAKLKEVLQSGTSEQDMETLEAYYQSGSQFLRRDVLTLLNNWNGEIDRAVAHKLRPHQQETRYGTSTPSDAPF